MGIIRNPTLFSRHFGIKKQKIEESGLFDPMLNVDTNLFVDPVLLKRSRHREISTSATAEYRKRFYQIISLLKASRKKDDAAWRAAKRMIQLREVQGTCLGYGASSISGRSVAASIQETILVTAKEIVDAGIEEPELFLLLPLFEEGIGPDTISDFTTSVIEDSLLRFTARMAHRLRVPTHRKRYKGEVRELILNPTVRRPTPVILLPQDILRHLPVASSWSEVSEAASFSHALRSRVNKMIGEIWRAKTKKEQRERKRAMLHEKELMADLLTVVKNGKVKAYNFVRDERGVLAWQKVIECVQIDFPFKISVDSSKEGLLKCVRSIVGQFRFLVEERGFNKMLWNKKRPNKEKVSQMLFFAVAHSYCRANDVDISPEMDTGSGLVDFKFAKGYSNRHIVEVKLSNNPNVLNGYKIQLEAYKRSEEVDAGTFVLVDVGGMGKKLDALYEIQEKSRKKLSAIEYVDARVKPSASKRR